jgi:hypothetical protein
MRDQNDYAMNGMVSVWIGNFKTDADFDVYMNLRKDFETDFGFKIDNSSVREAGVESIPVPIQDLARGFSYWETFAPAVVQAAREEGIESATTMIVFYCVNFVLETENTSQNAPLKFLGAFSFSVGPKINSQR